MKKLKLIIIGVCLSAGLIFAMPNPVHPAPVPQGGSPSTKLPPLPPPTPTPTPAAQPADSTSSWVFGKLLKALIG
jgi:hypothetical protein